MRRKTFKLGLLLTALLTAPNLKAQVYQHDYMTYHERIVADGGDVGNRAIYKDIDAGNEYYIAQYDPGNRHTVTISKTDPDLNILTSFDYTSFIVVSQSDGVTAMVPNPMMEITVEDITGVGDNLYVVGSYIDEGNDRGGFILKAGKDGTFKWFKRYTDIWAFAAVAPCDQGVITVGNRRTGAFTDPTTESSGVIVKVNGFGTMVWQKEVEDDKYNGHPMFQNGPSMNNSLSDIIALEDNIFVATGTTCDFIVGGLPPLFFPIPDGDGSMILFTGDGTIINSFGLGNSMWVENGGTQEMRHEGFGAVTQCSDGDIVLAGWAVNFAETYFPTHCPGPDPVNKGLWVTKLNPYTGTVAWSKIYDFNADPYPGADMYRGPGFIRMTNDGTDNIGINFFSSMAGTGAATIGNSYIMKLEPTAGGIIYTRRYEYNDNEGFFRDIASGFENTDLVVVGETSPEPFYPSMITTRDGWNVIAFDNIVEECNHENIFIEPIDHMFDIFNVEVYSKMTNYYSENYLTNAPLITNNIVCDKIEMEEQSSLMRKADNSLNSHEAQVKIGQEAFTNNIMVMVTGDDVYHGRLMNLYGQVLQEYDGIQHNYKISATGYAAGIYYLELSNNNKKTTKMVLIQ